MVENDRERWESLEAAILRLRSEQIKGRIKVLLEQQETLQEHSRTLIEESKTVRQFAFMVMDQHDRLMAEGFCSACIPKYAVDLASAGLLLDFYA